MSGEQQVIHIGKTYITRKEGFSRLCADITIDKHRITFWFAVDVSQEDYLCIGRADAFVTALLPAAMRDARDLVCEDPISEKLLYRINNYLVPTLVFAGTLYHRIHIHASCTKERYPGRGTVGTGFSGGVDCLYTIMSHGADSEYPLDYIAVFNTGNIESGFGKDIFWDSCKAAARFAEEQNLQSICVDTNFLEVLPENHMQVYSFRNLACALALQGLFSVYLLSSEGSTATFNINVYNCS